MYFGCPAMGALKGLVVKPTLVQQVKNAWSAETLRQKQFSLEQ